MSFHVLGGTYSEYTSVPDVRDLRGSGLRAALALVGRSATTLHTAVDNDHRCEAELIANGARLNFEAANRDGEIRFEYLTPLSAPVISGSAAKADKLTCQGDHVLVFGMLESIERDVDAGLLVFDPQLPGHRGGLDLQGLRSAELHLVLNAREARGASGANDPEAAARTLLEAHPDARSVVVKLAARGALVMPRGTAPVLVNPVPSRTVAALGTGDLFAAGYLSALADGADAVEAARHASAGVGYMSATSSIHLPPTPLEVLPDTSPWAPRAIPQVYLAAPFFTLPELWIVHFVRDILRNQGVQVFSPLHDVGRGDEIAADDLAGLDNSQAVLALTDHSDAGTLFEVGYATARRIPVVAHASHPDREGAKMITGSGGEIHTDLATAVYRAAWYALGLLPDQPGTPS